MPKESRDRPPQDRATRSQKRTGSDEPGSQGGDANGALESIFQEVVRRGASLGFSGFFLTEEAIRRAFSDRLPPEWASYVSEQSESMREELIDRMSKEFGNWLRTLDMAEIVGEILREREISVNVELKPKSS